MDWRAEKEAALFALEHEGRPGARIQAAERLRDLGAEREDRHPELAAVLPQLLTDRQPEVRRIGLSLAALALEPEEATPVLARSLSDEDSAVRMEAAGQLSDQARMENRSHLAPLLEDPSFAVRFEAARGLAALQHPSGLDVLIEALDRDELRFRALGALGQLADARALPALRATFRRWLLPHFERTQAAGALARLGDEAGLAHLRARTRRSGNPDRGLAIELLGEVKAPTALEQLLEILESRADPGRGAAARGLGRLKDPRAMGPLMAVLEEANADDELKLDAAEGLCRLGLPQGRARVEQALPSLGSEEARRELLGMLEETR